MTSTFNRPAIGRSHSQDIAGPWWKDANTGNSNPTFFLVLWFPKG